MNIWIGWALCALAVAWGFAWTGLSPVLPVAVVALAAFAQWAARRHAHQNVAPVPARRRPYDWYARDVSPWLVPHRQED